MPSFWLLGIARPMNTGRVAFPLEGRLEEFEGKPGKSLAPSKPETGLSGIAENTSHVFGGTFGAEELANFVVAVEHGLALGGVGHQLGGFRR